MNPVERTLRANGIDHHVIAWGDDNPGAAIVLCHGYLDMAWSWDGVGRRLAAMGRRVVAFDWRGHGESSWVGSGGYYHFPDYLLDLDELLPQLSSERVHLVGHSMGGTACAMYAGVRSTRLASLVLMEGLGPPRTEPADTRHRVTAFLDGVAKLRSRGDAKPMRDIASAIERMRVQNPQLDDDLATFLAERSTKEVEGGRAWRFDPLHRTTAPMRFELEAFESFLSNITVPTLLMFGEKGFRLADEKERAALVRDHRSIELPGATHMMHWFAPDECAEALTEYWAT